jgi:hypothetical protein
VSVCCKPRTSRYCQCVALGTCSSFPCACSTVCVCPCVCGVCCSRLACRQAESERTHQACCCVCMLCINHHRRSSPHGLPFDGMPLAASVAGGMRRLHVYCLCACMASVVHPQASIRLLVSCVARVSVGAGQHVLLCWWAALGFVIKPRRAFCHVDGWAWLPVHWRVVTQFNGRFECLQQTTTARLMTKCADTQAQSNTQYVGGCSILCSPRGPSPPPSHPACFKSTIFSDLKACTHDPASHI